MSGELIRWLAATPAERERDYALQKIHDARDVTLELVDAITEVSQASMDGTFTVAMSKRAATIFLPEDAAKFEFITMKATIALGAQIDRMNQIDRMKRC